VNTYRETKEGEATEWLYADVFPTLYKSGDVIPREEYRAKLDPSKLFSYEGEGNPQEAAARQVGGNHYSKHTIQPWHIVDEYGLDHYRATAIKYMLRNKMDVREDIQKAIHCLEHWLEINPNA